MSSMMVKKNTYTVADLAGFVVPDWAHQPPSFTFGKNGGLTLYYPKPKNQK